MKPSLLAHRSATFGLFASVFASMLFACAAGAPDPSSGDDDDMDPPPPMIKLPPAPKDGSQTSPGCNGIPESGKCEDGVATYCDVEADTLRRKDCKALGKSCVLDAQAGAQCQAAPTGGSGSSVCGAGVTVEGDCGGTGGQTATWCDPSTNQTVVWNCSAEGLECRTDCTVDGFGVFGVYCCSSAAPTPPPPSSVCPALGFAGTCVDSTHAEWCNGDTVVDKTCTNGQTCQVDKCADGAYCCDATPPPADECSTIGVRGVCPDADTVRWCSGGTVQQVTCAAGKTCQIDVCGDGAYCCDP